MSLRAISHQSRAAPRFSSPPREHVWRNALAQPWNQTCHRAKSEAGRTTTRHKHVARPGDRVCFQDLDTVAARAVNAPSSHIKDDILQFNQSFNSIASLRKVMCFCEFAIDNGTVNTGRHG